MKLIKFKLGIIALFVTLISVLMTGCSDQYEVAKKQGIVFSQDGTVLIKCSNPYISECVVPKGVIQIETEAFRDCKYLKSVKISDSVTRIGGGAFGSCYSLQSVIIGNGVETIGLGAFAGCRNLQSVIIPESVTLIEHGVFFLCLNLKEALVPKDCIILEEEDSRFRTFPEGCRVVRY